CELISRGTKPDRAMVAIPSQTGMLVVEFQGDIIRTLPLTFDVLRIGRAPDNDLALQHPLVSRRHAELSVSASGLIVTDLESANGTFIDGVQVLPNQPTRVEPGQTLQIGPFIFAVRRSPTEHPDGVQPIASRTDG